MCVCVCVRVCVRVCVGVSNGMECKSQSVFHVYGALNGLRNSDREIKKRERIGRY